MWEVFRLVLYGWVVILGLSLPVSLVCLYYWREKLVDGGWGMGKMAFWLVVGLIVWQVAHLGVGINSFWGIWLVVGGIEAVSIGWVVKKRKVVGKLVRERWGWIVGEEILFLIGMLIMGWMRGLRPDILDLEKFMDFGFINGYLRSPTLPAVDMWLAGEKINYYTFGHFLGAVMSRIWGIDLSYGYNLLLGVIMGLGLSLGFAVVVNMLAVSGAKRVKSLVSGGMAGALLLILGGNWQVVWYWLSERSFEGYWYASATRFIHNTIHEFPSYSFVVSDLHGHVWGLPVVLMFLLLGVVWVKAMEEKKKAVVEEVMMGGLLGVMIMTNTWDVAVWGLWLVVVSLVMMGGKKVSLWKIVEAAARMGIVMAVTAGFWAVNFKSIGEGVGVVSERSPLWQLAALWTGHVGLGVGALVLSVERKKKKWSLVSVMLAGLVITAIVLIAIPELIFVRDIYPDHPRANTMFKLTYQAFIMLSLAGGWLLGRVMEMKSKGLWLWVKSMGLMAVVGTMILLLIYPVFAYQGYYGKWWKERPTSLYGLGWLMRESPDDFEGIKYLREKTVGRPVIVEAVGESYSKFGRVSVFSGLPTVLGWRVHEWLWRGGFEIPAARSEEVKQIYEQPKASVGLLNKYEVRYIFVGSKEREAYRNMDEEGLLKLGRVVFERGGTEIIEID